MFNESSQFECKIMERCTQDDLSRGCYGWLKYGVGGGRGGV